jgi:hypothetical protein
MFGAKHLILAFHRTFKAHHFMTDNANTGGLARRMPFTNGILRFPKDDAAVRAIIAVFRDFFRTT